MTDGNKTEPGTEPAKTVAPDWAAEKAALERALTKREEDLLYTQRENDKLKAAKQELDALKEAQATKPDDIKKLKETWRTEILESVEPIKKERDQFASELRQERVISKSMSKAASFFNDDSLPLVENLISKNCDWDNGQIIVKDAKGEMRYSASNPRIPMSIDEYLTELAEKHPSIAKPQGNKGGAMNGTNRPAVNGIKIHSFQEFSKLSSTEQQKVLANIKDPAERSAFAQSILDN